MATIHRMAARGTARSQFRRGPAGPDECAMNERERGHSARPLRNHLLGGERRPWRQSLLASGAAAGRTARGARHRGAAGRCAPRAGARLALALRRRWAAAARITPLSITVRAVPCLPPPYRCTWRRPAAPAPPFYRLPPSPTLPTSAISLPSCLSRPSRRAPCHWPASLDRSTRNSSHTTLPSPPKRRPSLADSVGVLPRAVRGGGYSSERGKCGRAPLGAGTGTREISR